MNLTQGFEFAKLRYPREILRGDFVPPLMCTCYDFRGVDEDSPTGYRWASYPLMDGHTYHWHVCARFMEFVADRTDIDPANWTITEIVVGRVRKQFMGDPSDSGIATGCVGVFTGCFEPFEETCCWTPPDSDRLLSWWFAPDPVGSADQSFFAQTLSEIEGASGVTVPSLARWRLWLSMTGGFEYDPDTGDRVYETDETTTSPEVMAFCWEPSVCPPFCSPIALGLSMDVESSAEGSSDCGNPDCPISWSVSNECDSLTWALNEDEPPHCQSSECVASGVIQVDLPGGIFDECCIEHGMANGTVEAGVYLTYDTTLGYHLVTRLTTADGTVCGISGAFDGGGWSMFVTDIGFPSSWVGTSQTYDIDVLGGGVYVLHVTVKEVL